MISRFFSRKISYFLSLLIFLNFFTVSGSFAGEWIEEVNKEFSGISVKLSEYPGFARLLEIITSKLQKALDEEGQFGKMKKIHIIEAQAKNMVVQPFQSSKATFEVAITIPFIQAAFKKASTQLDSKSIRPLEFQPFEENLSSAIDLGCQILAGGLAHEYGHRMDNQIKLANLFFSHSSQIDELSADQFALRLLRGAGFQPDSLIYTFEAIALESGSFEGFLASHPADDIRLSLARIGSTMDRFQKGFSTENSFALNREQQGAIISDLEKLRIKLPSEFEPFQKFSEQVKFFEKEMNKNPKLKKILEDFQQNGAQPPPYNENLIEVKVAKELLIEKDKLTKYYLKSLDLIEKIKKSGSPLPERHFALFQSGFESYQYIKFIDIVILRNSGLAWRLTNEEEEKFSSTFPLVTEEEKKQGYPNWIRKTVDPGENPLLAKALQVNEAIGGLYFYIDTILSEASRVQWYQKNFGEKYLLQPWPDFSSRGSCPSVLEILAYFNLKKDTIISDLNSLKNQSISRQYLSDLVQFKECDLLDTHSNDLLKWEPIASFIYANKADFIDLELSTISAQYDENGNVYEWSYFKIPWKVIFRILGKEAESELKQIATQVRENLLSAEFWEKVRENKTLKLQGEHRNYKLSDDHDWFDHLTQDLESSELKESMIKFISQHQLSETQVQSVLGRTPFRYWFIEEDVFQGPKRSFDEFLEKWRESRQKWHVESFPIFLRQWDYAHNLGKSVLAEDFRIMRRWILEYNSHADLKTSILKFWFPFFIEDDGMYRKRVRSVSYKLAFFEFLQEMDRLKLWEFEEIFNEFKNIFLNRNNSKIWSDLKEDIVQFIKLNFDETQKIICKIWSNTNLEDQDFERQAKELFEFLKCAQREIFLKLRDNVLDNFERFSQHRDPVMLKEILINQIWYDTATEKSDHFLETHILKEVENFLKDPDLRFLELTERHYFYRQSLQHKFIERILEIEIKKIKESSGGTVSEEEIKSLLLHLGSINASSVFLDQLLERLAWELDIQSPEILKTFIEDRKTTIKSTLNESQLRGLSAVICEISSWSLDERFLILCFVLNPSNIEIEQILSSIFSQKTQKWHDFVPPHFCLKNWESLKKKLSEASDLEKFSLVEMLLKLGAPSLLEEKLDTISKDLLKLSDEQIRLLRAYLRSTPEFENSATLAYLLVMRETSARGIKSIFEIFSTVGIKTGQLAAIWNYFGDQSIADELSGLKDEAHAINEINKFGIIQGLMKNLAPEEFKKIKRVSRVLGRASLKTVVLLEVEGNSPGEISERVAHIRRPYAKAGVCSNIKAAHRFLDELEKEGFQKEVEATRALLYLVEAQLREELDPSLERLKTQRAAELFGDFNHPKTIRSGPATGWQVQVPTYIEDSAETQAMKAKLSESDVQVDMMELAQGVPFDQVIDPEIKQQAGHLIVQIALDGLFRKGCMNADPHRGNYLVDSDRRILYPVDFGQFEEGYVSDWCFVKDDLYLISELLRALANAPESQTNRNSPEWQIWVHSIARKSAPMALTQDLSREDEEAFSQSLLLALQNSPEQDPFILMMNALIQSGRMTPRKQLFGFFKGLLVLQKENYVSPEEFRNLLQEKMTRLLQKKAPCLLMDSIFGGCS